VSRIVFIRRAKDLGFSLAEIKSLLALKVRSEASCGVVKRRTEVKIAAIDARIADLRRIRKTLGKLITACEQRKPTAECPILDSLER
jgi:DNA-binding transcriptional MerR regulator